MKTLRVQDKLLYRCANALYLLTRDEARRIAANIREAAGAVGPPSTMI